MSRSEPSSPRTGDFIRQFKTLRATTDELARLWHTELSKSESKAPDGDNNVQPPAMSHSLSLPPLKSTARSPSSLSLDSLATELSKSSSARSLSSSVLSDLSELLMTPKHPPVGSTQKPRLRKCSSASVLTSIKYATPAARSKAAGEKLVGFFGVSPTDIEFSDKYRKLIRMFGRDFPSHTAVLGMIAEQKRLREYNTYNVAKLYGEETSEEQVRQRKKLESFAGLTEDDYGKFVVQLKLFHKLGEHIPLEELRQGRGRSASLPPELEQLGVDASKIERMLGAKKTAIAGQEKCVKASKIFGEMLPTDYCEELADLDQLDQAPKHNILKAVRTRKSSDPVTKEELKQAKGLASSPSKKRFFGHNNGGATGTKDRAKSVVSPQKKGTGAVKAGANRNKQSGLSISGMGFKTTKATKK